MGGSSIRALYAGGAGMADDDKSGFKVTDKRRFTGEGEAREGAAQSSEQPRTTDERQKAEEGKQEIPPIDFPTFILSLASSAQVHLGLIPNPVSGKPEKNLGLAKQTIDILAVLQEKTKGNLAKEEDRLLEGILYDLRMKFVELNK